MAGLADVPFYGAYIQRSQMNQQEPLVQLQQASGALGLAQKLREQEQQQAFSREMGMLGPEATHDQIVGLASKYATSPEKVLAIHQAAANRESQMPEILRLQGAAARMPEGSPQRAQVEERIKRLGAGTDKPEAMSPLGRLINERDQYPDGHPMRAIYDQAITKFQPGGITVNVAPNAPLIPGKPAQNKIDEGLLDTGMRLQRLSAIESQFRPEFQQIGTRLDAAKVAVKDKIGLSDLDPGEKKFLTEFSQYKRNSIDSLNQYIKSITGAAMTDAEAARILKGLPNAGTGIFDGDSPTEFKAKLDDAIKQTRLAEARLVYIKRNGLNLADVELDRMPSLMNKRGGEIEEIIKKQQPTLKEADVRKLVRRNLAQEFGLVE